MTCSDFGHAAQILDTLLIISLEIDCFDVILVSRARHFYLFWLLKGTAMRVTGGLPFDCPYSTTEIIAHHNHIVALALIGTNTQPCLVYCKCFMTVNL